MTDPHNQADTQTLTDKAKTIAEDSAASISETAGYAADEAKSLLLRAQEAIGQAVDTTIEAFKERPLTSAAIAGGVVAAAAGASYGVKKLFEESGSDLPGDTGGAAKKNKAGGKSGVKAGHTA